MSHPHKIALTLVSLFIATNAWANTATFTFDQDACSGTCGLSPFATLTLVENGSGAGETVTVTETLRSGDRFAGTGAGEALEFNIAGTITLTNLTSNFSFGSGAATASAFGSFSHYIDCTTCQGGQAGNPAGPISFTVGSATGVSIASFTANTGGFYFASDIVGSNGNTGNVAARSGVVTQITTTPEPGTVAMMLSGLVLTGLAARRKRG